LTMASPKPRAPPVTMATLSCVLFMLSVPCLRREIGEALPG
jgi:hypothetical protein